MSGKRDTLITGIGLLSSLGEGKDIHLSRFSSGDLPVVDNTSYPTFPFHPLGPVDFDKQIPKKGDQRQMEPWQRIGTYAAGLALTDAGIAGNADILSRTDMIVAAAGGERDVNVDASIADELRRSNEPEARLNARLQNELRPTLFLAQLSNLLAGNISIVHGVVGSSRTFMGEEGAGVEAVRIASARIAAGQSQIALVGGAYNAARPDMMALWEFASLHYREAFQPIFATGRRPGMITGTAGAFLVVEAREHAEARGAKAIARIADVRSARGVRSAGGVRASIGRLLDDAVKIAPSPAMVFSTAAGTEPVTGEEAEALGALGLPVRAITSRIGQVFEPAFPFALAMGALAIQSGEIPAPLPGVPLESAATAPKSIIVSTVGHWRGEGVGVLSAA